VKRIRNCPEEGPGCFPKKENYRNSKIGWGHLKLFFSRTTGLEELMST
jgi:hypothetical protein